MLLLRYVIAVSSVGMVAMGCEVAAQNFPNRPVRIVAAPVGGGGDFVARTVAQALAVPLGQPVIVDNRPARLTGEVVAKSTPDGYTLLLGGGSFMFAPLLGEMPYDAIRDFSPVAMLATAPTVIVVNPSLPVKSVKELIAYAKTRPGELNFGSSGNGGGSHLSGELFKFMAGINIVHIPYKGGGIAVTDLIAGQVQIMFSSAPSVATHIKSGKLRGLAVTSLQPSPLAPGLPTAAATGLPGYEVISIDMLLAPANTPSAVIKRLNEDVARALTNADLKERFFSSGIEAAAPVSPTELATILKSEINKWGKLIKSAGIKGE